MTLGKCSGSVVDFGYRSKNNFRISSKRDLIDSQFFPSFVFFRFYKQWQFAEAKIPLRQSM